MKKVYAVVESYEDKILPVLSFTRVLVIYEDPSCACETVDQLNDKERSKRKEYEQKYKEEPDDERHYYVNAIDFIESDKAIKIGD